MAFSRMFLSKVFSHENKAQGSGIINCYESSTKMLEAYLPQKDAMLLGLSK